MKKCRTCDTMIWGDKEYCQECANNVITLDAKTSKAMVEAPWWMTLLVAVLILGIMYGVSYLAKFYQPAESVFGGNLAGFVNLFISAILAILAFNGLPAEKKNNWRFLWLLILSLTPFVMAYVVYLAARYLARLIASR